MSVLSAFVSSVVHASEDTYDLARNGVVNLLSLITVSYWLWIRYRVGHWIHHHKQKV